MIPTTTTVDTWDQEYRQIQSIPSSTRRQPSKALLLFEQLVPLDSTTLVLDAGCGNGRNAIYLASKGCNIVAVDFSPVALKITTSVAQSLKLINKINVINAHIVNHMPFANNQFDICLDSYVSCHFTNSQEFNSYWSQLARLTKIGGFIFSSVFSDDDEYYKAIATRDSLASQIVTDPVNGITKKLYCEKEIKSVFPSILEIRFFLKFQFMDHVLGQNYLRSLYIVILQKSG